MADENGSVKLVEMPNRGRALIASRPLKGGEIILKDSPIVLYSAVPDGAAAANYCTHCFRRISPQSQTTVACPNCSVSLFCSAECQSVALRTSHTQFVCQCLTHLRASYSAFLDHDGRLQARFLISAYNMAVISPSSFQTLLSLQGESFVDNASVFLHSLISSICPVSNLGPLGFSVELTSALLAKDKVNAFGLMGPFDEGKERSVRAYGIYPRASFFNHDCLPNACRFDYVDSVTDSSNADIVVRVIHDLPAGREICLSYFPVNLKFSERQKRLTEDYGFTCECDRCKVEANWSDDDYEEGDELVEEEEDDGVDEDVEQDMGADVSPTDCDIANGSDDFPHAYFFVQFMCSRENCGGTLAPLPPADTRPSSVMECNVCGSLMKCEEMVRN